MDSYPCVELTHLLAAQGTIDSEDQAPLGRGH